MMTILINFSTYQCFISLTYFIIQGNRNPYQLGISNHKNDVCKYLLEVHTEREQVLKANAKVNQITNYIHIDILFTIAFALR